MKAWLILQEGPGGTGQGFLLDPAQRPLWSVGRSKECDITLGDRRASRHHADIRWNGQRWEVADRGSTNGTYVNGLQVHKPYDLRFGDRITIGETTLVLREYDAEPVSPTRPPRPHRSGPTVEGRVQAARPAQQGSGGGASVAFWLAQGVAAVAVICLGTGAFLPWLQVTGSVSSDLAPQFQGIAKIIMTLTAGTEQVKILIDGLKIYGPITLVLAIAAALVLSVDAFWGHKSAVAGIVYLVMPLFVSVIIGADAYRYAHQYEQLQNLKLIFGLKVSQVIPLVSKIVDLQFEWLIGLNLTVAGLLLLLLAGVVRLGVYALVCRQRRG